MSHFVLLTVTLFTIFSRANVVGSDAQNFNPTTDGIDFVTVHSHKTLPSGIFNIGLFWNYAVNTLPFLTVSGDDNPQSENQNDSLTTADINFAFGITNRFALGFSFPYLIAQDVDERFNLGRFENAGTTEIKVNAKAQITGNDRSGSAVVGSVNFNRIENNPWVGTDGGPSVNLEWVYSTLFSEKWIWGLNLGYRLRNPGEPIPNIEISPTTDQIIASTAFSYYASSLDTKFIWEVFTAYPTKESDIETLTDRDLSSAELLFGVKYDFTTHLASHAGFGTELFHGNSSPDWRIYLGFNWNFGPVWGKKKEPEFRYAPVNIPTTVQTPTKKRVRRPRLGSATRPYRLRLDNINFDSDSDKLPPRVEAMMLRLVDHLSKYQKITKIIVEGHTDSVGEASYNLQLSVRRAKRVRLFLKEHLPDKPRSIESVGYGESKPIEDNGNYQGRAANRRVELQIFGRK